MSKAARPNNKHIFADKASSSPRQMPSASSNSPSPISRWTPGPPPTPPNSSPSPSSAWSTATSSPNPPSPPGTRYDQTLFNRRQTHQTSLVPTRPQFPNNYPPHLSTTGNSEILNLVHP